MDAARALADLVETSPQIEAAAVFGGDGESLGSVGVTDWWATAVTRAGKALLDDAAELRSDGGRVTQLHASLAEGDVFVVGSGGQAVVAVTSAGQAPGLVFYDLKRCLVTLAEPEPEPSEPKPSRRRRFRRNRERDDAA